MLMGWWQGKYLHDDNSQDLKACMSADRSLRLSRLKFRLFVDIDPRETSPFLPVLCYFEPGIVLWIQQVGSHKSSKEYNPQDRVDLLKRGATVSIIIIDKNITTIITIITIINIIITIISFAEMESPSDRQQAQRQPILSQRPWIVRWSTDPLITVLLRSQSLPLTNEGTTRYALVPGIQLHMRLLHQWMSYDRFSILFFVS